MAKAERTTEALAEGRSPAGQQQHTKVNEFRSSAASGLVPAVNVGAENSPASGAQGAAQEPIDSVFGQAAGLVDRVEIIGDQSAGISTQGEPASIVEVNDISIKSNLGKGQELTEKSDAVNPIIPIPGESFINPTTESLGHMHAISEKLPAVQEDIPQVRGVAFFGSRIDGHERTDPSSPSDLDTIVFYDGTEFETDESRLIGPDGEFVFDAVREVAEERQRKKAARTQVIENIRHAYHDLMHERGLPVDKVHGKDATVLVMDVSQKSTDSALDVFRQYVDANTDGQTGRVRPDGINGFAFPLVSRFLPSIGEGMQQNREYIFSHFEALERDSRGGERYLRGLMDCLRGFIDTQADSRDILPQTIAEARAYYNIQHTPKPEHQIEESVLAQQADVPNEAVERVEGGKAQFGEEIPATAAEKAKLLGIMERMANDPYEVRLELLANGAIVNYGTANVLITAEDDPQRVYAIRYFKELSAQEAEQIYLSQEIFRTLFPTHFPRIYSAFGNENLTREQSRLQEHPTGISGTIREFIQTTDEIAPPENSFDTVLSFCREMGLNDGVLFETGPGGDVFQNSVDGSWYYLDEIAGYEEFLKLNSEQLIAWMDAHTVQDRETGEEREYTQQEKIAINQALERLKIITNNETSVRQEHAVPEPDTERHAEPVEETTVIEDAEVSEFERTMTQIMDAATERLDSADAVTLDFFDRDEIDGHTRVIIIDHGDMSIALTRSAGRNAALREPKPADYRELQITYFKKEDNGTSYNGRISLPNQTDKPNKITDIGHIRWSADEHLQYGWEYGQTAEARLISYESEKLEPTEQDYSEILSAILNGQVNSELTAKTVSKIREFPLYGPVEINTTTDPTRIADEHLNPSVRQYVETLETRALLEHFAQNDGQVVKEEWQVLTGKALKDILASDATREALLQLTAEPVSEALPAAFIDQLAQADPGFARLAQKYGDNLGAYLRIAPIPDNRLVPDITTAWNPEYYRITINEHEKHAVLQRYRFARDVELLILGAALQNERLDGTLVGYPDGELTRYNLANGIHIVLDAEKTEQVGALLDPQKWERRSVYSAENHTGIKDRVSIIEAGGKKYILKERKTSRHRDVKEGGYVESATSAEEFAFAKYFNENGQVEADGVQLAWEKPIGYVTFPDGPGGTEGFQFALFEYEEGITSGNEFHKILAQQIEEHPEFFQEEYQRVRKASKKYLKDRRTAVMEEVPRPGGDKGLTFSEFAIVKAKLLKERAVMLQDQVVAENDFYTWDSDGFGFRTHIDPEKGLIVECVGFDFEYAWRISEQEGQKAREELLGDRKYNLANGKQYPLDFTWWDNHQVTRQEKAAYLAMLEYEDFDLNASADGTPRDAGKPAASAGSTIDNFEESPYRRIFARGRLLGRVLGKHNKPHPESGQHNNIPEDTTEKLVFLPSAEAPKDEQEEKDGTNLVEEKRQRLNELGFTQIGETELFQRREDGIVIGIDKKNSAYKFLFNYNDKIDPSNIHALSIDSPSYGQNDSLQVLQADSVNGRISAFEFTLGGAGGFITGDYGQRVEEELGHLTEEPITEQLTQAGFVLDEQHPEIWRRILAHPYNGEQEVIVIVHEDKVSRILKSLSPKEQEQYKLDEGTEIVTVGEARGQLERDKMYDVLTLQNDFLTLDISGEYGGWIQNIHLTRELSPEEIGVESPIPTPDISSPAFIVGGVNDTAVIRSLQGLNGKSIEELEEIMRPSEPKPGASTSRAGFIGENESLLEVLAADNDFVRERLLTHQEMAEPIKYARRLADLGYGNEFALQGSRYKMTITGSLSAQFSPYGDSSADKREVTIENLTNGKSLHCSFLLADLIYLWGCYEGHETEYRLDQQDILDVFPYLNELSKRRLAER